MFHRKVLVPFLLRVLLPLDIQNDAIGLTEFLVDLFKGTLGNFLHKALLLGYVESPILPTIVRLGWLGLNFIFTIFIKNLD
mmetsp:Transcript_27359/g.26419  ORF Transcript_27359/g.26419 Transcript_27359/m.26419 type:complete len:81 (-) Transcript_27359:1119-1361(-)